MYYCKIVRKSQDVQIFAHNFTIVNLLLPKLLRTPHIYAGAGSKVGGGGLKLYAS